MAKRFSVLGSTHGNQYFIGAMGSLMSETLGKELLPG
jgi:hypothetical protein